MKRACLTILLAVALGAAPQVVRAQGAPNQSPPQPPPQQEQTDKDPCVVPETFTHVDGRLPRVAIMARERKLDVLVEGTGSSSLGGPQGMSSSYPARLEAALVQRLPGVTVAVRTDLRPRRTAAEMVKAIREIPADTLPGLLIWQTGTVDAIRGIDPDEFREALEEGVKKLRARGIDVILVNMQYSPRTELMIKVGPYAEAIRWVSKQTDVPLFDRLGVMQYWSENRVFDFTGSDRSRTAERVHDCIGRLLTELIVDAAGLKKKAKQY